MSWAVWTPGPSTLGWLDPRPNYPRVDGPPRSMYTTCRVDGPLPGWLDPPLVAQFSSQNVRASLLLSHTLAGLARKDWCCRDSCTSACNIGITMGLGTRQEHSTPLACEIVTPFDGLYASRPQAPFRIKGPGV